MSVPGTIACSFVVATDTVTVTVDVPTVDRIIIGVEIGVAGASPCLCCVAQRGIRTTHLRQPHGQWWG